MIEVYIANAPWMYWKMSPGVEAAVDSFVKANSIEPNKLRFIVVCRHSTSSVPEMNHFVGALDWPASFDPSRFEVYRWRPDTLQVEMAIIVAH